MLLWWTIINYGILLVWIFAFMLARDWIYQFHGRFCLSVEQFDFAGMSAYEIGILLLNSVRLIAF